MSYDVSFKAKVEGADRFVYVGDDINHTSNTAEMISVVCDSRFPSKWNGTKLVQTLGHAPVKVDHKGIHNTKVGFRGSKRTAGENAKIANVLEYGRKGVDQAPKPFLKPAIKTGRKKCVKAIKDKLSEEFNKIL